MLMIEQQVWVGPIDETLALRQGQQCRPWGCGRAAPSHLLGTASINLNSGAAASASASSCCEGQRIWIGLLQLPPASIKPQLRDFIRRKM